MIGSTLTLLPAQAGFVAGADKIGAPLGVPEATLATGDAALWLAVYCHLVRVRERVCR
jgi:hypothetical protein